MRKTPEPDAWVELREAKRLYAEAEAPEDRARAIAGRRSALRLAEKQFGASQRLLSEYDALLKDAASNHRQNRGSNGHSKVRIQLRSLGAKRAVIAARLNAAAPEAKPTIRVRIRFDETTPSTSYDHPKAEVAEMYAGFGFTEADWERADAVEVWVKWMGTRPRLVRLFAGSKLIAERAGD